MVAAATTIGLSETKPLDAEDLERLRRHASLVLEHLHNENESESCAPSPSWIGDSGSSSNSSDGESESESESPTPSFQKRYFDANGFWVARGFCNADEAQALKTAMTESVRLHWFPRGITKPSGDGGLGPDGDTEETELTTFGTDTKSHVARGDPFLESADKVSYFAEPTAIDSETGKLKSEFQDQHEETKEDCKKMLALCKAGHGLHLPPSFRRRRRAAADSTEANDGVGDDDEDRGSVHKPFFEYTTSSKLRELVLSLGYRDPVVPQSMYIFKNPVVGGAVHSHQDSTFLYTTPRQTCLGLWLALDDATLDNGCLWVRPKSHFEPVRLQFLRNPKYNENDTESESKLTFKQHHDNPSVTWEGTLPESVDVAPDIREVSPLNFIPVEVRAGDLVVFCGTLDHFSLPNFSDRQRHTFQLHLVEGPGAGVTWSRENWLQYGEPLGGDDAVNDAKSDAEPESKFLRLLDYA